MAFYYRIFMEESWRWGATCSCRSDGVWSSARLFHAAIEFPAVCGRGLPRSVLRHAASATCEAVRMQKAYRRPFFAECRFQEKRWAGEGGERPCTGDSAILRPQPASACSFPGQGAIFSAGRTRPRRRALPGAGSSQSAWPYTSSWPYLQRFQTRAKDRGAWYHP